MKVKLGIIFIHGAGLGNYIWNDLELNSHYSTLMIEYPNRNSDGKANAKLSFEDYVAKAISDTEKFEQEKLIIITHSIGGLVGLRIAERFKEKTIGFVGIGAAIPKNGNSFVSCLPFPQKLIFPVIMKLAGTQPPKSAIVNGLCNDLNPTQTEKVVNNFTAESRYLYIERSKSRIPDIQKLYIELTNDNEFSASVQKKMAANLKCKNIVELKSSHLPMLSFPKKLSGILNEFINNCIEQSGGSTKE